MKPLLLFVGLLVCSCASRGGSDTGFEKSEQLVVRAAEFVLLPSSQTVVLSVEAEVRVSQEGEAFLQVDFPVAESEDALERKTLLISGSGEGPLKARSSAQKGLRFLKSYPVKIRLTEDRGGELVVDELTQWVRFEVPPQALEKMGVKL